MHEEIFYWDKKCYQRTYFHTIRPVLTVGEFHLKKIKVKYSGGGLSPDYIA